MIIGTTEAYMKLVFHNVNKKLSIIVSVAVSPQSIIHFRIYMLIYVRADVSFGVLNNMFGHSTFKCTVRLVHYIKKVIFKSMHILYLVILKAIRRRRIYLTAYTLSISEKIYETTY